MTLTDELSAALAAWHHLHALWPRRGDPLVRRWLREYCLCMRLMQDRCEHLAATMRRERQEYLAMKDDDTQALRAV